MSHAGRHHQRSRDLSAQFAGDAPPFHSLDSICHWAASLGYKGVQVPSWDGRLFDLKLASESSKAYCDDVRVTAAKHGLAITELSTHLQGQLVAVHPAYASMFQVFAPSDVNTPDARASTAANRSSCASRPASTWGSTRCRRSAAPSCGTVYPWPQRPTGLVEEGFRELARRWRPLLDYADDCGVDCAFEIHPGEDLHDGATYEMFLDQSTAMRALQLLYHPVTSCAGARPPRQPSTSTMTASAVPRQGRRARSDGRVGVYGGYRAGSTRPDGSVRSATVRSTSRPIFSQLTTHGYEGWAMLEWECCLKHPEDGAREGAEFIKSHIIRVTEKAFDDFAGSGADQAANRKMLGIG